MELIESRLKRIDLKTEYLFVLLPFIFILGDSLIASLFVFFLFIYILKDRLFLQDSKFILKNFAVWMLLLVWGIYIVYRTPKLSVGIVYYFGVLLAPFLLFTIIQNFSINLRNIYIFFVYLFISGIILGILTFYVLTLVNFDMTIRISSLFWNDRNILSSYYMILFMFCLSFIIHNVNPRAKIFHFGVLGVLAMSLFLIQTRGVWLALLFSIAVFFIKRPKVIIIASIIILLLAVIFRDIIMTRYLSVVNFGTDLSSLGRLQAWIASIVLIKDSLLIGYWFDSFLDLRDNAYSLYLVPVIHSHNTYLRSILETGLIGSILYFSFFFRALYYSVKLKKKTRNNLEFALLDGLQLSFVSLMIVFFFEPYFSLFGCSTLIIWMIISLSFKMNSIIEYESETKSGVFTL
jgi:O-antigen ligase